LSSEERAVYYALLDAWLQGAGSFLADVFSRSTERRGGIATADSGTKVLVPAPQISDMLNDTLFAICDLDERSTRTETVRGKREEGPISFDVRRDTYTGRDGHSNDGTRAEARFLLENRSRPRL